MNKETCFIEQFDLILKFLRVCHPLEESDLTISTALS